jgi:hypothetical protein
MASKLNREITSEAVGAQFEKAATVAKLKAARERVRNRMGKCEGQKSYAESNPVLVASAKELSAHREPGSIRKPSLRWIAARLGERGYVTPIQAVFSKCCAVDARLMGSSGRSPGAGCSKISLCCAIYWLDFC